MCKIDNKKKNINIYRYVQNTSIFLQIVCFVAFYSILHPVFRNRLLLTSSTCLLSIVLIFLSGFSVILGFVSTGITRSDNTIFLIATNMVHFSVIISVLVLSILIHQNGMTNSENFQTTFSKILKTNAEGGMQALHNFQQTSKCCGVPLKITKTTWNQSSVPFSNPWSSWYYHTILGNEYIEEARRLFTLPWSCCAQSTWQCEHLAFERVSISPSHKHLIIDELTEIEHRLGANGLNNGRDTVFDESCLEASESFLAHVPLQVVVVGSVFASIGLISIATNVALIIRMKAD